MKTELFDKWCNRTRPELVEVLKSLKSEIDDDMIDSDSDVPYMQITISTNDDAETWSIQTGDNSYTGSCYGDPYWGVGCLTRDCDPSKVAEELFSSIANVIEFQE